MPDTDIIARYLRDPAGIRSDAARSGLPLWLVCAVVELDGVYRVTEVASDRYELLREDLTEAMRDTGGRMDVSVHDVGLQYGGDEAYARALVAKSRTWATRLGMSLVDTTSDRLPMLAPGEINGLVSWLKIEMAKHSEFFKGLGWDPMFTPELAVAMVEFQRRHNRSGRPPRVREDGVVDTQVWNALQVYGIEPRTR